MIAVNIAPCKDCGERAPQCHSNCTKYKEWKERINKINANRRAGQILPFYRYKKTQC